METAGGFLLPEQFLEHLVTAAAPTYLNYSQKQPQNYS
jgi:hypothetical protein